MAGAGRASDHSRITISSIVIRDGLPVMFFWEDTSDEAIRRGMTIEEAFDLDRPTPFGLVHAYVVTFSRDQGFNPPHQAPCGFEVGADLRLHGGFHIDQDTFNRIADAAERLMSRGRHRPELLAIVLSHTRFASPTVVHRRVLVGLAHEIRIKSNPRYQGRLRFVGEWSGVWRFEKTS